jgi:diketogulonate reductase-like aldo/keto reductase
MYVVLGSKNDISNCSLRGGELPHFQWNCHIYLIKKYSNLIGLCFPCMLESGIYSPISAKRNQYYYYYYLQPLESILLQPKYVLFIEELIEETWNQCLLRWVSKYSVFLINLSIKNDTKFIFLHYCYRAWSY